MPTMAARAIAAWSMRRPRARDSRPWRPTTPVSTLTRRAARNRASRRSTHAVLSQTVTVRPRWVFTKRNRSSTRQRSFYSSAISQAVGSSRLVAMRRSWPSVRKWTTRMGKRALPTCTIQSERMWAFAVGGGEGRALVGPQAPRRTEAGDEEGLALDEGGEQSDREEVSVEDVQVAAAHLVEEEGALGRVLGLTDADLDGAGARDGA